MARRLRLNAMPSPGWKVCGMVVGKERLPLSSCRIFSMGKVVSSGIGGSLGCSRQGVSLPWVRPGKSG